MGTPGHSGQAGFHRHSDNGISVLFDVHLMNVKIFSDETCNVSLMQSFHSVVIYIPVDIGDKLNNFMKML